MPTDPHSLTIPRRPVTRPPDIVHTARPISGTAIVRSVPNRDHDRASTIIGPGAVVRSIAWICGVITFTATGTKDGENQGKPENKPFRLHTNSIRFRQNFRVCILGTAKFVEKLDHALIEHCVRYFHESSDVRANYQVARVAVFSSGFPRVFENREHDVAQTRINFFARPR
jgi:hypothetical protein